MRGATRIAPNSRGQRRSAPRRAHPPCTADPASVGLGTSIQATPSPSLVSESARSVRVKSDRHPGAHRPIRSISGAPAPRATAPSAPLATPGRRRAQSRGASESGKRPRSPAPAPDPAPAHRPRVGSPVAGVYPVAPPAAVPPPSSVVVSTQGRESGGSWFDTCSGVWYPRRRACGVVINTLVDLTNWLGKPQVLAAHRPRPPLILMKRGTRSNRPAIDLTKSTGLPSFDFASLHPVKPPS